MLLGGASPDLLALVSPLGVWALLTMIAETMILEAVEVEGGLAGLFVVLGHLTALELSKALSDG